MLSYVAQLRLLVLLFCTTGVLHFVFPHAYERIVPQWLPAAPLLVQLSGIAELLGAVGLLTRATRRAAGWGLLVLLVAVFPANVEMWRQAISSGATPAWQLALLLRLPLQGVLLWWIWRVAVRRRLGAGSA